MHELARKALLADLRLRNPVLERDLRRRIVDYLYRARRRPATSSVMIDMAHLVENPLLRWGFGWDGNVSFRIDSVRPGDADRDRQPDHRDTTRTGGSSPAGTSPRRPTGSRSPAT